MKTLLLLLVWTSFNAEAMDVPALAMTETPPTLTGTLYEIDHPGDKNHALFKFKRIQKTQGNKTTVDRTYTQFDGTLALEEHVLYEDNKARRFEIHSHQTGERGVIEFKDGRIFFQYTDAKGKQTTDDEEIDAPVLVPEQIPLWIMTHWKEIQEGDSVGFRLVVEDRKETVGFKVKKDREETKDGRTITVVKMGASSVFVSLAVKPLYFYVETQPKMRVIRYDGRTKP